jgi:hypothetical protein
MTCSAIVPTAELGVLRNAEAARFALDSLLEGNGFELSVPRRESNESPSGTGTVTEATKVRLEAVAYLPGTDGSNPFPSTREMVWGRRRGNGTIVAVAN